MYMVGVQLGKDWYDFQREINKLTDENAISVSDKTIKNLTLIEKHFQYNIVIENCHIVNNSLLEKINGTSIIFKKCEFYDDIMIKNIEANVLFQECTFHKKVRIHYDEKYHGNSFEFIYTTINNNIIFDGFNGELIKLLRSKVNKIELEQYLNVKNLHIQDCEFDTFRFRRPKIDNITMVSSFIYQFFDLNIELCELLYIDNTEINNMRISESFKKNIINNEIPHIFFLDNEDNYLKWSRIADSLLVMHHTFEKDRHFDYADKTFQLLRNARVRRTIYDRHANLFNKMKVIFESFFIGTLFGWGVNLKNSLYTIIAIIMLYSLLYMNRLYTVGYTHIGPLIRKSLQISTERFFNLRESAYDYNLLPYFETQQSLIGIIVITITTAMIVRKIIR